jgi:hypothetical protein
MPSWDYRHSPIWPAYLLRQGLIKFFPSAGLEPWSSQPPPPEYLGLQAWASICSFEMNCDAKLRFLHTLMVEKRILSRRHSMSRGQGPLGKISRWAWVTGRECYVQLCHQRPVIVLSSLCPLHQAHAYAQSLGNPHQTVGKKAEPPGGARHMAVQRSWEESIIGWTMWQLFPGHLLQPPVNNSFASCTS